MNGPLIVACTLVAAVPMLAIQLVLLRASGTWLGSASRSYARAAAIGGLWLCAFTVAGVVAYLSGRVSVGAVVALFAIVAGVALIARGLSLNWWRASIVGLLTLSVAPIWGTLAVVNAIPIFYRSFVMNGNAMAPTILGEHVVAKCPQCGAPAFCSPAGDPERGQPEHGQWVICSRERTSHFVDKLPAVRGPADRFLVNYWGKPQRWDVVAFRNPAKPEVMYAMRLVGLPGETITIHNGKVFADGMPLELPESLKGAYYEDQSEGMRERHGTVKNPAHLGTDEYFVLGDFSMSSNDSRLWEEGANGHAPFAVPVENIVGVVEFIYWPAARVQEVE